MRSQYTQSAGRQALRRSIALNLARPLAAWALVVQDRSTVLGEIDQAGF
jgi:hypothetical protein